MTEPVKFTKPAPFDDRGRGAGLCDLLSGGRYRVFCRNRELGLVYVRGNRWHVIPNSPAVFRVEHGETRPTFRTRLEAGQALRDAPTQSGHGGARRGSGRKRLGEVDRVSCSFSMPPALLERLERIAGRLEKSRSEVVCRLLEPVLAELEAEHERGLEAGRRAGVPA